MSHLLNIKLFDQFFADNTFWSKSLFSGSAIPRIFSTSLRLVLAQSHKISRSRRRLPHSLRNSESGIVLLCLPTVRSSSISNIPHPWKSCRNHFYRNRIRSWDRYIFFCSLPTVKSGFQIPDRCHIIFRHHTFFSFRNFLSFCLQYGFRCRKF